MRSRAAVLRGSALTHTSGELRALSHSRRVRWLAAFGQRLAKSLGGLMLVCYRPLGPKTRFLSRRPLPQPSRGLCGRLGRPKDPIHLRSRNYVITVKARPIRVQPASRSSVVYHLPLRDARPLRASPRARSRLKTKPQNRCPGRRTAAPRAQRPHITNEARETTPGPTTRRRRAAGQRRPFRRAGPKPRSARRSKTSLQSVGGGKPSPGGVGF